MKRYRVLLFSLLEMVSPLHLGSGKADDPFSDQPVLRNSGGIPFLPGGTLAGSIATRLTPSLQSAWLGIPELPANDPQPSPLVVDDAYPLESQAQALRFPVDVRDQVSLCRDRLTAQPEHYFNMEVLPVGSIFRFSCRCDMEDMSVVNDFLSQMREFLSIGGFLGGKQNAGNGRWQSTYWATETLDLCNGKDLTKWLVQLHGFPWNGRWDELREKFGVNQEPLDGLSEDDSWQILLEVELSSGLHLSASATGLPEKEMPDLCQAVRQKISEDGKLIPEFVDYGTSIKGRLRTAMEMLLRTYLRKECNILSDEACKIIPTDPTKRPSWDKIADLFGYTNKKGAWRVEEQPWNNGEPSSQDHICLDEFTQQAIHGFKFDFSPLKRGKAQVVVSLPANAPDWQKALVFFAGKLLSVNILPWGGHASRGYVGARIRIANEKELLSTFNKGALKEMVLREMMEE